MVVTDPVISAELFLQHKMATTKPFLVISLIQGNSVAKANFGA